MLRRSFHDAGKTGCRSRTWPPKVVAASVADAEQGMYSNMKHTGPVGSPSLKKMRWQVHEGRLDLWPASSRKAACYNFELLFG